MAFNSTLIIVSLFAYIIGSIPTGFIVSRLWGVQDIRAHGSGNIGATNVGRVLGYRFFILVFILDALKAFAFLKMMQLFTCHFNNLVIIALFLLLGNCYSLFLQFQGGKGVATLLGILPVIAPFYITCIFLTCWLLVTAVTKVPALASLSAILLLTIISYFTTSHLFYFFLLVCFLITWRHRSNIVQLL